MPATSTINSMFYIISPFAYLKVLIKLALCLTDLWMFWPSSIWKNWHIRLVGRKKWRHKVEQVRIRIMYSENDLEYLRILTHPNETPDIRWINFEETARNSYDAVRNILQKSWTWILTISSHLQNTSFNKSASFTMNLKQIELLLTDLENVRMLSEMISQMKRKLVYRYGS